MRERKKPDLSNSMQDIWQTNSPREGENESPGEVPSGSADGGPVSPLKMIKSGDDLPPPVDVGNLWRTGPILNAPIPFIIVSLWVAVHNVTWALQLSGIRIVDQEQWDIGYEV